MGTYQTLYFDYQATTPLDPVVFREMQKFFSEEYGNPHSADHMLGWTAKEAVEKARGQIADLIGSDSDEIIFTSGATESNNLALQGIATHPAKARKRILVSSIEHKSILATARHLEQLGYIIDTIPVDQTGAVDLSRFSDLLRDDVLLVSVMAVNNEIGTIQPIKEIAELAHEVGAFFHTDAAQAPVALELDVAGDCIDMLSLSGHKIYGPKGIGVLFVQRNLASSLEPIIHGGGQEGGLRSGTLPTPQCVGFGAAAKISKASGLRERVRQAKLRNELFSRLQASCQGIRLNGPPLESRHPGNLNVCFPGIDAHHLLSMLQPKIAASTGSACTSGLPEPSHVLRAIGLSEEVADSSVRFSIGRFSTETEVAEGAEIISDVLNRAEPQLDRDQT